MSRTTSTARRQRADVRRAVRGEVPVSLVCRANGRDGSLLTILRTSEVEFDVFPNLHEAGAQAQSRLTVVTLDALSSNDVESLKKSRCGQGDTPVLLLCDEINLRKARVLLRDTPRVGFMSRALSSFEGDFRTSLIKSGTKEIFGLDKYFGWGVLRSDYMEGLTSETPETLGEFGRLFAESVHASRVSIEGFALLCHRITRRTTARGQRFALSFQSDGVRLGLGCRRFVEHASAGQLREDALRGAPASLREATDPADPSDLDVADLAARLAEHQAINVGRGEVETLYFIDARATCEPIEQQSLTTFEAK